MSSHSFAEKVQFFNQVDALGRSDTDGEDSSNEAERQHRNKCRAFFQSRKKPKSAARPGMPAEKEHSPTNRTRPAPTPRTTALRAKVIKCTSVPAKDGQSSNGGAGIPFLDETPVPDSTRAARPGLSRSSTHPLPPHPAQTEPSPAPTPTMRKRKRNSSSSAKSVPESDKLFRGLAFYYIPNNDVAPARKIRIGKAQEYGAQWARTLEEATHAIVDKNLAYKDVEKILKPATAALVIVNEDYPIDSISFRTLLNPHQHRYGVAGCTISTEPSTPSPPGAQLSPENPGGSLTLNDPRRKPKGGHDLPLGGTPPRSIESSVTGAEKGQSSAQLPGEPGTQASGNNPPNIGGDKPQRPPAEPEELGTVTHMPRDDANDELTEYISLIQQYKDLPLDEDDDDLQSLQGTNGSLSDSDSSSSHRPGSSGTRKGSARRNTTTARKSIPFEEHFACNRGGTQDEPTAAASPNARTIEVLQSMCDYYTRINDHWRTTAYRKAISTLRRQKIRITSEEEAYRLPTIGPRLAQKIAEIVQTDRLRRLEYAQDEPLDRVLETFLKIYDVGTSRASKWIAQGFRTLDDLKQNAELTANQRLGIDHYDDLNTRIPRAEVTALGDHVRAAAAAIDPRVELLTGGSYRRGSDSSGDIDLIVTRAGTSSAADLVPFLDELIAVLTRRGFLVATLASLHGRHQFNPSTSARHGAGHVGSTWQGCCVLPRETAAGPGVGGEASPPSSSSSHLPVWRRIDFLLVPETEFGAALIYFTGNDIFNRSMRLLALRKGMRLNQRGLYREVMRGPGKVKLTEGELVEGRDERRIFEILGVKWREPRERWC